MDIKHQFGAEIEKELAKIGLDLKGHYPLLKTGVYTLNVDLDQTKVGIWYGPETEKLASCKLYAEDVARKLAELNEKITARRFDDEAFFQILHDAAGDKDHISIPDLVTYLADHDVYGTKTKKTIRTFLSYDLYRLSKRTVDDIEISLVTATRAYTQRKSDFLWIPPGMYISHIKFRKIHPTSSDIRKDIDAAVRQ